MAVTYLRPEEHHAGAGGKGRLGSCGRPAPLISLEIRDDEDRPVPTGHSGEICVHGDLVMQGYYKNPEATARAIVDGWLHTGDVGRLDEDGYLYITDRKKDLIISGGLNVYPAEIEQVIWSHPAVADCAVIGVPDEDWGELVTAVVELADGGAVTAEELISRCRQELDPARTPKRIEFVPALPRSTNGKVLKRELRRLFGTAVPR